MKYEDLWNFYKNNLKLYKFFKICGYNNEWKKIQPRIIKNNEASESNLREFYKEVI